MLAALLCWAGSAAAAPTLGAAYGEGMVLQRDQSIVVKGEAAPGSAVAGELGEASATASAGPDGRFRLTFRPHAASAAPLVLAVTDTTGTTRMGDILVGDVFLCAGQSNMELPVTRALDAGNQLRRAADPAIRLLKIPQATATLPQDAFAQPVAWTPATADSVATFSAACFYMAKRLRADAPQVPVGLIHSNWSGSAARAWLTAAGGRALYGQGELDLLELYAADPLAATQAFVPRWYEWWRAEDEGREPWRDASGLDWRPVPAISFWNSWAGSGLDTQPLANVWLTKRFTLSPAQAAAAGTLAIGSIDDLDLTWVNGQPVGYTFGWGVERSYRVPAELLRAGENEVLILANNSWDTGGFYSTADRLAFTPGNGDAAIPLGEGWRYAIAGPTGVPPRAPWDANAGIGVMHNRMIAPLGAMRLAGVAWYQGESDVGQAGYGDRLRELSAGWRRQFGDQIKLLVVQLADFGERQAAPAASGWAELRQAQLSSVAADTDAALVSAIDIGEPGDIHPANKNELGRRLALAAQGEAMPMPAGARREGDWVIVTFTGIEGDLRAYGGAQALGVELCGDTQESCRFVLPELVGATMRISLADDGAGAGSPTRVRHAWADAPVVNLFDARDLPVPGFELPIAP